MAGEGRGSTDWNGGWTGLGAGWTKLDTGGWAALSGGWAVLWITSWAARLEEEVVGDVGGPCFSFFFREPITTLVVISPDTEEGVACSGPEESVAVPQDTLLSRLPRRLVSGGGATGSGGPQGDSAHPEDRPSGIAFKGVGVLRRAEALGGSRFTV